MNIRLVCRNAPTFSFGTNIKFYTDFLFFIMLQSNLLQHEKEKRRKKETTDNEQQEWAINYKDQWTKSTTLRENELQSGKEEERGAYPEAPGPPAWRKTPPARRHSWKSEHCAHAKGYRSQPGESTSWWV